jgi:GDP-D-mannose 3',5'-epimerase
MILVTGAGGFIGGHLVADLAAQGEDVRSVDIKPISDWYQVSSESDNRRLDLKDLESARSAIKGVTQVYNLAADMGGMGFIENNKADCMLSVLINTNLLMASREENIDSFFFSSTACVYAAGKQKNATVEPLKESDAYPAEPEDGYGWEKLFSERMCRHFREDFHVPTKIARYHNVYGPLGTYDGGREKAPSAICRKVALAVKNGSREIEIWGDGEQTRSFTYISDCVKGTKMLQGGNYFDPINLGSSELVSINQLVSIVEDIAGVKLVRKYNLSAPQGVRGRNSDNTLIKSIFEWEPNTSLINGMQETYKWVYDQV